MQINERYVPQLQQVLTWPQSIGIVGGRPSSSLYFVGCQHDQVIYLDPHQAQQVGPGLVASSQTYLHGPQPSMLCPDTVQTNCAATASSA